MKKFLSFLCVAALAMPALAQNQPSVAPRTQGVQAGYGDPVQVTIRSPDGSSPGSIGTVTVASDVAQGSTTSGQTGELVQCAATTTAPSYTTAKTNPLSCDTAGALRVTTTAGQTAQGAAISGVTGGMVQGSTTTAAPSYSTATVNPLSLDTSGSLRANVTTSALPAGAATAARQDTISAQLPSSLGTKTAANSLSITPASDATFTVTGAVTTVGSSVAQGSTTSGQTGPLVQGAVTTSAPSYTTAQTSPLSLTTAGGLRVDNSANTQPVAGSVASGASDSGNPVKIGGFGSTTTPSAVTAGQRTNAWTDLSGATVTRNVLTTTSVADSGTSIGYMGNASSSVTSQVPLTTAGVVWNGTALIFQRGDTNGLVVQPGLSTTFWSYTSGASPILSNTTTAVTIKASAGGSLRNYIDACQLTTTAFATSVPLAIRDGASGTVLWALTVPANGFLDPVTITFPSPLKGTAATLMEVVTTTANTSGTVTLNCQGHTGL